MEAMLALMLWFDKERFGKRPEAKAVYMKVRAGLYGYGGGVGVSLRELRGLRSDVHFGLHSPASCAFIAHCLITHGLLHGCAQKCTSECMHG